MSWHSATLWEGVSNFHIRTASVLLIRLILTCWYDGVAQVVRIWSYENNVGGLSPQLELVARMKLTEAVLVGRVEFENRPELLTLPSSRAPNDGPTL